MWEKKVLKKSGFREELYEMLNHMRYLTSYHIDIGSTCKGGLFGFGSCMHGILQV